MSTDGTRPSTVIFLCESPRTPPVSEVARRRIGSLLRELQRGGSIGMPISRPMPSIGAGVHELRVSDGGVAWRVIYRIDPAVIVVAAVFAKTTQATPNRMIRLARKRLADHDAR